MSSEPFHDFLGLFAYQHPYETRRGGPRLRTDQYTYKARGAAGLVGRGTATRPLTAPPQKNPACFGVWRFKHRFPGIVLRNDTYAFRK